MNDEKSQKVETGRILEFVELKYLKGLKEEIRRSEKTIRERKRERGRKRGKERGKGGDGGED